MVDTGAGINLIKRYVLHPEVKILGWESVYLSGITDGQVKTLGSVETELAGQDSFSRSPGRLSNSTRRHPRSRLSKKCLEH